MYCFELSAAGAETKALRVEQAKERQKIKSGIFSSARTAQKTSKEISRLKSALKSVQTGRLAVARQQAGKIIPGVRDANAEAFNSAVNQFALSMKDQILGGGILSDSDVQLLKTIGPELGNTPEANLMILERFEEINKNSIDRARRLKAFKGDPLGFEVQTFTEIGPTQEEQDRGGKLQEDAQGNRAIVFPDGTFRELN